mgnify:CR=1 FL=1
MDPFYITVNNIYKEDYKATIIFDDLGMYYYMPEANNIYRKEQLRLQQINDDYIEIVLSENERKGTSFMRQDDGTIQININFFSKANFFALKKFLNIYFA